MKTFDSKSLRSGYVEQVFQQVNYQHILIFKRIIIDSRLSNNKYNNLKMGYFILCTQEIRNEIILNAELAKRSMWIINNYDVVSGNKCKTTAVETKKRLEQLSKQLKVSYNLFNPN